MQDQEYVFKVVLAGDPRVGKTSIRRRYLGKGFESNYLHTIGADFAKHTVEKPGYVVQFQIWDLSGQHSFSSVREHYYTKAKALVFVYALNDSNTFYNIYNWLTEYFKHNDGKDVLFFIVGNKVDLDDRQISKNDLISQMKLFTREFKVDFTHFETSALSGQNINEMFEAIIKKRMSMLN